jgi:hypothetical protein
MAEIKIQSGVTEFQLKKLLLENHEEKKIDITKIFKDFAVVEDMQSLFIRGKLVINDTMKLREQWANKGKMKVHIAWKTTERDKLREMIFSVVGIPKLTNAKTGQVETITFDLVDYRYLEFIKKSYYKHYYQQDISTIMKDIFKYYGVSLKVENDDISKQNYYNLHGSSLRAIHTLKYYTKQPGCVFQQYNDFIFTSYRKLFDNNKAFMLSSRAIVPEENKKESTNSLSGLSKGDLFNEQDIYIDGVNGYDHFNIDLWNNTYSLDRVKFSELWSKKLKFEIDEDNVRNIKWTKNSKGFEDYILFDFISAQMSHGISDLAIGKLINIPLISDPEKNKTSIYSGNHLIYRIQHEISGNYQYKQYLTLVREKNL